MKTKTILSTHLACAAALALAATVAWSCAGKFEYGCPEGSTQTAGGGDVKDACTPNDQLPGGSNGAGGGGGAAGSGAGMGGAGGGTQGGGGAGGAGGSGGGSLIEENVLVVGGSHTCARTPTGVLCWGGNRYGQLGSNVNVGTTAATPTPSPVESELLKDTRQLALAADHSCALGGDGRVLCWGRNTSGELGTTTNVGTSNFNATPSLVGGDGIGGIRQVVTGSSASCALRDDGRVLCWGSNKYGELGDDGGAGTNTPNPAPRLVESDALVGIRQLAAGDIFVCALRDDGRVLCWGSNSLGQLGTTTNSGSEAPNPTPGLVGDSAVVGIRQLSAGSQHVCALRDDSRVLCWGSNYTGQLGRDTQSSVNPTPALVDEGALTNVRQIASGFAYTCSLRDNSRVVCWGYNRYGQLGDGTSSGALNSISEVPIEVNSTVLTNVSTLAVGGSTSCALREDGRVFCWGGNSSGQLGNSTNLGTENPTPTPVEVQGLPLLTPPSQP